MPRVREIFRKTEFGKLSNSWGQNIVVSRLYIQTKHWGFKPVGSFKVNLAFDPLDDNL